MKRHLTIATLTLLPLLPMGTATATTPPYQPEFQAWVQAEPPRFPCFIGGDFPAAPDSCRSPVFGPYVIGQQKLDQPHGRGSGDGRELVPGARERHRPRHERQADLP